MSTSSTSIRSDGVFESCLIHDAARWNPAEIPNAITHGLGLALSLVAAVVLMHAAQRADSLQFLACGVYAATMVAVYAASTCSHMFWQPRTRHLFRMLDQGCIYLFIAGSFTPVSAAFLRERYWWVLLAAMWLVALAGFISKVFLVHRVYSASVVIPVLLGWLPVAGGPPMLELVPAGLIWWMLAGGVCYTMGIVFLINDERRPYLHVVWHLWVIAGTACQFVAICKYTLPV